MLFRNLGHLGHSFAYAVNFWLVVSCKLGNGDVRQDIVFISLYVLEWLGGLCSDSILSILHVTICFECGIWQVTTK